MSADAPVAIVHPAKPIRTLIIADVRLYREGLAANLTSRQNLTVVGATSRLTDAFALIKSGLPDVVILDMATPDSLDIVATIGRQAPGVKVIAFAIEGFDRGILACADAGVAGYLPRDSSTDELVAMIEKVNSGETHCSPRLAALLLRRLASLADGGPTPIGIPALTQRQVEIVALIDDGLCNKEIAARLVIELATVKNHVHNILDKLQVSTRAEAAARLRAVPSPNRAIVPTARL